MKPPALLDIAGTPYEVRWDEASINRAMRDASEHLSGSTDTQQQKILVNPDLGPMQQRRTLLHEVLHAVWECSGLHAAVDGSNEEPVIRGLEAPLLETLRRNPKLIAYLLEE